jgi:hypothetical protein
VAQGRHEAIIDLIRIGVLVEQYKAREGYYPDTLDDIASNLGGSVPVDPFSGRSYHYRLSGRSFILYGVDLDLRDDGGTSYNLNRPDMVWRGHEKR